jgi:uncharacterized protein (TIGR02246 family)
LLLVCGAVLGTPAASAEPAATGIGGFFFRAHDPKALTLWYQTQLGVLPVPSNYGESPWRQEAGPTAFAPFPETTKMFGAGKDWMLNFRVRDLDGLVARLRKAGIAVKVDPTTYPNGRFADLHDPEGNPVQLWEPGGVAGDPAGLGMEWAAAWTTRKLDKLMALYAPDAEFLTTSGERWSGAEVIAKNFAAGLAAYTGDITLHSTRHATAGDLAYESGTFEQTVAAAKGGKSLPVRGNYLFVFARAKDGAWKIQQQSFTEFDKAKL